MTYYLRREWVAGFAQSRPSSLHLFLAAAVKWVVACRRRQRERRELLDFMAGDHRAAADMGITAYDARSWAERPFWRD